MDEAARREAAATAAATGNVVPAEVSSRTGYFRWVICALLLAGTTKNYMDRQVLGLLKPMLQHDLGWNEIDYSNLVFAFQAAYALGMVFVGRLVDRLGTRVGYSLTMAFWSLAAMGHALVSSLFGFGIARFALGFGEAGVFPASLKTVAEWFQKRAGIRDRHFQFGDKHRRDRYTADRATDCAVLGLALGVCGHRRAGIFVAGVLAADLSQT